MSQAIQTVAPPAAAAGVMIGQIHVAAGKQTQTLSAQQTPTGVWLLSTFADPDGWDTSEVHMPATAGAWLAGVAATMLGRSPPDPDTLATRLRAIAVDPRPATLELLYIAAQVARMELALNEIVAEAAVDLSVQGGDPAARWTDDEMPF
jgi:hypothetical protein